MKGTLPQSAQTSHTQLAHALVQYLGVEAPTDLEQYGIRNAGDLVNLISRVSRSNVIGKPTFKFLTYVLKFSTNTHTLTTPNLTQIGLAVSPLLSLFNHSCEPNAVLVFPGSPRDEKGSPSMQLVCIRDINPGDEVSTNQLPKPAWTTYPSQIVVSYVDTTLPCDQRRTQLKDTYGFDCTCTLCQQSENQIHIDPRAAIYCPGRCGGISFFPTQGTCCG